MTSVVNGKIELDFPDWWPARAPDYCMVDHRRFTDSGHDRRLEACKR